jgi:hypothetical protein
VSGRLFGWGIVTSLPANLLIARVAGTVVVVLVVVAVLVPGALRTLTSRLR